MIDSLRKLAICIASCLGVSSCGTQTPSVHEFWGSSFDAVAMESAVLRQITCELSNALNNLYRAAKRKPDLQSKYGYIFKWNAQVVLTFTVDEQSSLNPTPSFISKLHPITNGETFTLGLTGTYKNQATRVDKLVVTFKVKEFLGADKQTCHQGEAHHGTLFVQSDLKIEEWLSATLNVAVGSGPTPVPVRFVGKTDAISHDVKFVIVSSGGVAPVWKLVRFGTGTSPLLQGQRDRIQQLLITMGPADGSDPDALGPVAQFSSLASQINSAGRFVP